MTIKETYNQAPEKSTFSIIANDDYVLHDTIKLFNHYHDMDVEIIDYIHDEVTFAVLQSRKMNLSKIFELGYSYGCALSKERREGNVNY